jgi:hypothetical protein
MQSNFPGLPEGVMGNLHMPELFAVRIARVPAHVVASRFQVHGHTGEGVEVAIEGDAGE